MLVLPTEVMFETALKLNESDGAGRRLYMFLQDFKLFYLIEFVWSVRHSPKMFETDANVPSSQLGWSLMARSMMARTIPK